MLSVDIPMTLKIPKYLNRKDYPELDLILWDVASEHILAEDAFKKYETRWRYINPEQLCQQEYLMIKEPTKCYGNGLFLSAWHSIAPSTTISGKY
jgi:hypothetical protein